MITTDAKSKTGVFTVHEVKEKYYYEIPKTELNREFLFTTQIARTTMDVGYGGQFVSERVVRWERHANKSISAKSITKSWPIPKRHLAGREGRQ